MVGRFWETVYGIYKVKKGEQMKALILNSGLGSRMGVLTKEHPKCMTDISDTQ